MNAVSIILLAFSMSADAFAVALCKGASRQHPRVSDALRHGVIFGGIEAMTPLLGWALGVTTSSYIAAVDHWIIFAILCAVGGKMVYESTQPEACEPEVKPQKLWQTMLTALATSLDALAVGVSLAFMNANIIVCSAAIGAATFLMVTVGIMIGHYAGTKLGKLAEVMSGGVLIAIGFYVLAEHLHFV